jgi:HNH endonuclease
MAHADISLNSQFGNSDKPDSEATSTIQQNCGKGCRITGCTRPRFGLDLCNMHYARLRRTGTTEDPKRNTVKERFWSKVDRKGIDECWEWTGARLEKGYGAFSLSHTEQVRAHRFAYELLNGRIGPDQVVLHQCDNPPCCNPFHLSAGSPQDNVNDRDAKGRQARGEMSGLAKLLPEEVREIKEDPRGQREIARQYGICKSTVGYVKRGETWGHLW